MRPRPVPGVYRPLPAATEAVLLTDFAERPVPEEGAFSASLPELARRRLAPLALRYATDHRIPLPEATAEWLRSTEFHAALASSRTLVANRPLLARLEREGIPFVVVKGPGIAACFERSVERPYTDIDILVAPGAFDTVVDLARGLGYAEASRNLLPWASLNRRCREAINLDGPDGAHVDVHHRIPPWIWADGLTFDLVHRDARPLVVAGFTVPVASPVHNLLISALHVFSDHNQPGANLMAWRDVLVTAAASAPEAVIVAAREAGLTAWLQWILSSLPAEARPQPLADLLGAPLAPALPRTVRLRLLQSSRIGQHPLVSQVLRLPAGGAALFMLGLAVPSPGFLRAKYPDARRGRYRRWLRQGLPSVLGYRPSSEGSVDGTRRGSTSATPRPTPR